MEFIMHICMTIEIDVQNICKYELCLVEVKQKQCFNFKTKGMVF